MQKKRTPTIHDARYRSFIEQLTAIRVEANVHQTVVAEKMRLTQPDVSKIERFERRLDVLELWDYLKAIYVDEDTIQKTITSLLSSVDKTH